MHKITTNKPIVSISILVSNRKDTIRKCMESIRPILEQVPSELIVIDTVGEKTDGSIEIVREYTNQIYPFLWCNDFSAARNEGLNRAKGEWFMFLDDDEWFEDVTDIIIFFLSGEYKKFNSATYLIHDYQNREGNYSIARLKRMVKLEKNTKFCGRIHEYLTPLYLPCKELNSFIHHYGYIFATEEEAKKHSERNISLLLLEFENNPKDMALRMQIIQDYMFCKEYEEKARTLCEETFLMDNKYHSLPAFQWILTAYVRLAERMEKPINVIERVSQVRAIAKLNAFATISIGIIEIKTLYKLQWYDKILEQLSEVEKAYQWLLQNPEQRILQSVLDFPVLLEASVLEETWKYGILSFLALGEKEKAMIWTKKRQELLKRPIVTISLLVSNNIVTIENCLESLNPLLENDLGELIIIDTVGKQESDGSIEVAKKYTQNIYPFSWCNDFAAARNEGLSRAKGEWFMFLDDDEWFEDISEIVEFFQTGEYLLYNSATYRIRNYKNREGSEYSVAELGRMIRIGKNTKFVGRVHETFSERFLPCKSFSAYVHHYGYVYDSEEEKQKHQERNLKLLQEELKDDKFNLRLRTQMALELASVDNKKALEFCEETFRLCKENKNDAEFQWQLSLVFRLYEALGVEPIEADNKYQLFKETFGYSETAENAICYQMTRIHIIFKNYIKAYPYILQYFATLQYLREHTEIQQLQMIADIFRYQSNESYLEMLYFAGYCAWQSKLYQDAWFFFSELPWEQEGYKNIEGLWHIINLSMEYSDARSLFVILQKIMKNTVMKNELGLMMQNPIIKQKISETMEEMKRIK